MTDLLDVGEGISTRRTAIRSRVQPGAAFSLPSPAAPKEFFVAMRALVGSDFFSANLSRAVVQIVRQSQLHEPQKEAADFVNQGDAWQVETDEREHNLPPDASRLPDLLTSRLASILRDAEHEGRLGDVIDSFGKMVAAGIVSKGETSLGSFLDHAMRLDGLGQTDTALDIIFDQIDEMLLAGKLDRVNQLLIDTATDQYSVELLLGVLTATLPAKDRLPDRGAFFDRVNQTLQARGELKDGLLVGLN